MLQEDLLDFTEVDWSHNGIVVLFGDHETLALEQKGVCGFWRKADANVDDNS